MKPPVVLAYHGLVNVPPRLDPHNLMVDPARFRDQVASLRRRGYSFVTLSEFGRSLRNGSPPSGLCALTFDDGSADNAHVLPEVLEALDVPATVFVCPGLLGRNHPFMPAEAGIRLMSGHELRGLGSLAGVEIGSHTSTHADLASATADEAYYEMASSKAALEDLLGRAVESFAYPGCRYSAECPEAAKRAGYSVAVTCGPRGTWNRYELRRESVDSRDRAFTFALKSRGLFWPIWASPPGRAARWAARPLRHRQAMSSS
jgi:peptidoglycan/xylan/chitin deacetylase (PgdA/CDA1 family)